MKVPAAWSECLTKLQPSRGEFRKKSRGDGWSWGSVEGFVTLCYASLQLCETFDLAAGTGLAVDVADAGPHQELSNRTAAKWLALAARQLIAGADAVMRGAELPFATGG